MARCAHRFARLIPYLGCAFLTIVLASPAPAQTLGAPIEPATPSATLEAPEIPAAPQLGGPLFTRPYLTGDWLGHRSTLADCGITFDLYGTQFFQGVVSGGQTPGWQYGGKLDYLLNLDGQKLGLWKGLFVNLHGETRLGNSVNQTDGLLAPSNIAMSFPEEGVDSTGLTAIKITQMLSPNVAVYFGKLNTLDEYPFRYNPHLGLSRPGIGGFMNTSFVFNPIAARTVPYSALAVGGALLKEGEPFFTFTVFDPEERATTGFQNPYARGVVLAPDLVVKTRFLNRPGQFNLGGTYSTASYRTVEPSAYLTVPGAGIPDPQVRGSWCIYANGYQAIWVDPCDAKRTWGAYFQLGFSDGDPNPIRYVAGAGLTGRSMLPGRKIDTFGAGFFYLGLSEQFKDLTAPVAPQRDEYGIEVFYNYAITPWSRFTVDLQVARPSTQTFNTVIIPGIRLELIF